MTLIVGSGTLKRIKIIIQKIGYYKNKYFIISTYFCGYAPIKVIVCAIPQKSQISRKKLKKIAILMLIILVESFITYIQ